MLSRGAAVFSLVCKKIYDNIFYILIVSTIMFGRVHVSIGHLQNDFFLCFILWPDFLTACREIKLGEL